MYNYKREHINKRALTQALKQSNSFMLIGLLNLVDVQQREKVFKITQR